MGERKTQRVFVWDLPTRLFHWLLVAAVTVAVITGKVGGEWIVWHGRAGLSILGLLVFRVIWGVVGFQTARFRHFVRGPGAIRAYLRGEWRGIGHNPLGALAVLALLGLIAAQVSTGLFSNDDIVFQGPLADLVSKEQSDSARGWHATLFYGLVALIALHVAAIAFYARIKKQNLVRPMLTGWQVINDAVQATPRRVPVLRRIGSFALASALAGVLVYLVDTGAALTVVPPPPAAPPTVSSW